MQSRIVFDPDVLSGKPIIKGTRISVEIILEWLASGMSTEEIMTEYPHLKKADILAAVTYAAKALKHEELVIIGK